MSETQLSSYEEIPYESKPLYPTHPDCLATLATLLGMQPAPVDRCRVLELGCASGGNLIPMAMSLPDSQFLGIDLSARQIADGLETVKALGLKNIELRTLSITDIDDAFGKFDFIACHGVYSWVPPAVQDKILDICSRNLAPQGVAYVSYNTYPGWHLRAVVREMMGYHVKRFDEPMVRVQQARAFLDFLIQAVPSPDSTYHRLLRSEGDVLRPAADTYLFHEHLEDANYPLYFWQFMERATGKGLQYLGESWFHTRLDNLPESVQETVHALSGNILELEQYLDFLHNRTFRRTLLCLDNVRLNRTPPPSAMARFHLTGLARPLPPLADMGGGASQSFALDNGTTASTNLPVMKAALCALHEVWPRPMPFQALSELVQKVLAASGQETNDRLAEAMLRCYLSNLVALHIHPPQFVTEPGERPVASPLARHQAATSARLTNLRHRLVELGEVDRAVLGHLDASRDRAALVDALTDAAAAGAFTVGRDGKPVTQRDEIHAILREGLEPCLRRLAKNALLTN